MPFTYEDEAPTTSKKFTYLDEEPASTPNPILSTIGKVLNPLPREREALGAKVGQDVQIAKDVFGATGFGKALQLMTAQPIKTLADHMTSPAVVGPTVAESANPMNWLGVKAAPKIAKATTSAAQTVGAAIKKPVTAGVDLITAGSPKRAPDIAGRIRDAFAQAKQGAGDAFGTEFEQLAMKFPDRRVSLRTTIDKLNEIRAESPKLMADLNSAMRRSGNKLLKDVLDNPELADDLDLHQAQEIKKSLQKAPALSSKAGKFGAQYADTDLDLIDAVNDVKSSMMGAFEELAPIYEKYGGTINKFKTLKNKFKVGSLIGNVGNDFGDPEVMRLVNELLPTTALKDIDLLRKSMALRNVVPKVAAGAVGTTGVGAVLKYALGK